MNKLLSGVCVIGLVIGSATAVNAKAPNAAQVQTQKDREAIGCLVSDGEFGVVAFDATCNSHIVNKFDKDGVLISQRYQDKGELQPGQTAPDRATSWSSNQVLNGPGGQYDCLTKESVAPSGRYSSSRTCKLM